MKHPNDTDEQSTELRDLLTYAKNTLHEQQELFIALKAYQDLSLNEPEPKDLFPGAQTARVKIKEAKIQFENLHHIVYGVPPKLSSNCKTQIQSDKSQLRVLIKSDSSMEKTNP